MNDSPGWVPPGSSPADRSPGDEGTDRADAPQQASASTGEHADQPRNWSAQQPPPAGGSDWAAPPPAPPAQPGRQGQAQPGWQGQAFSGRPGWDGGGWSGSGWTGSAWNQPPAAKPGVVPLRPLGVGEILDGAVTTMRTHWRTVLGISLAVAVVVQLVATVVAGVWLPDSGELDALSRDPNPSLDELTHAMSGTLGTSGVASLIDTLGAVLATAMLTVVVSRAVLGRSVTTGEAWASSRPQLLRLLGLLVLVPLIVAAAILAGSLPGLLALAAGADALGVSLLLVGLLAGMVAAVWLWVRYSLAAPALMLERQGVVTALRRSAKLVRGNWWRVCGIQLLAVILVVIVSSIVQMPATFIGMVADGQGVSALTGASQTTGWTYLVVTGVGAVVASTVTFPLRAGVTALLYLDQRIRREALDIELARAAGVPGYGDDPDSRPTGS